MKRKVLMVMESNDAGNAHHATIVGEATCATCKWARTTKEPSESSHIDGRLARTGFPLRCEKAQMIDTHHTSPPEEAKLAERMCVTIDGSEYFGELYVKPDFGCVQWEGK